MIYTVKSVKSLARERAARALEEVGWCFRAQVIGTETTTYEHMLILEGWHICVGADASVVDGSTKEYLASSLPLRCCWSSRRAGLETHFAGRPQQTREAFCAKKSIT